MKIPCEDCLTRPVCRQRYRSELNGEKALFAIKMKCTILRDFIRSDGYTIDAYYKLFTEIF